MLTLEEILKEQVERLGNDHPAVQMLRNQIIAEKSGKNFQELSVTGSVMKESKMPKRTLEGWQTSVSDAPQPTLILYGANLRDFSKENSTEPPQPKPMQGESPSPTQSSLELAAAASRLRLEQNRKAQQDQGIQSASDKIKQLNEQKK
jgi:hypothetical protein